MGCRDGTGWCDVLLTPGMMCYLVAAHGCYVAMPSCPTSAPCLANAGCSSLLSLTWEHAVSCQPSSPFHSAVGKPVPWNRLSPPPLHPICHPHAVVQFMVATVRILLWRRWERLARQAAMPRSRAAKAASIVMADQHEAAEPPGLKEGSGKDVEPPSADGAPPSDVQAAAADAQAAAAAAAAGQAEQGTADSSPAGASLAAAASMAGSASQASSSGSQLRPSSLKKLQSRARFVWKFKPADFHEWGASGWLMEFAICLVQALWPNLGTYLRAFACG